MTSRFLSGLLLALSIALFVSACGTERGSPQRQEPIEATSQAFSVTEDGGTPGSSCGTMGGMCGKPTCTTGIGTLTFADSTPAGAPVTNIQLTLGGSECAGETFTARLNGLLLGTGLKFASNTCACNACTTQTLDFPFPAGNPNYNKGGPNSITILPTPAGGLCLATIAATITGPQAVGVAPPSGPTSGGTLVTITGTDFPAGTPAITFGGVAGTSPTRVGATSMTVVTPANPLGAVSIVITYPGGASQTLTNAFTYLVNPSTPTIVQDVNPTVFGQLVTFTVNVSGGGPTPTGTVSFYNASGPILLGTASLDGGGNAAFAFGALPVGTDSVYATYNGDGYYNPATSASTMHTVNQASTTVAL
ncbi:MAG TPA: Ig-like domain repeat protein, partial [Polyangiaceae bacterium]|nr:Ig-like domain repeat protein [Polyangiaceae bacterium]